MKVFDESHKLRFDLPDRLRAYLEYRLVFDVPQVRPRPRMRKQYLQLLAEAGLPPLETPTGRLPSFRQFGKTLTSNPEVRLDIDYTTGVAGAKCAYADITRNTR